MTCCGPLKFVTAATCVAAVSLVAPEAARRVQESDTAEAHHRLGVEHHLQRSLDAASREYARTLELDPPRIPTPGQLEIVQRFAPRIYAQRDEFFPLKDFATILHPDEPLIAFHLFWEDDIDFPEDNDPCDHEVMWVQYSGDTRRVERVWTYFHGRILEGGETALLDARQHGMRARVNAQWGKHGSMPAGWETLPIQANAGDIERQYLPLDKPITLKQYNEATYRKLNTDGRRLLEHPMARRLGWPDRFNGRWEDFVDFSRAIDPRQFLERGKMVRVSRWNSATIDQHFVPYNFRPKTEWPE
jgi:hypothetical protein